MQAIQHQQGLVYQMAPGYAPVVQVNTIPGQLPVTQTDRFAHIRMAAMFPLSAPSDVPIHHDIISESSYVITKQIKIYKSVVTRWATYLGDGASSAVVVDIYQLRNPFSMGTSPFVVQVNREVQLLVAGKFNVNARPGKAWSKYWTRQRVEEVSAIVNGVAIPLELVSRAEERVAPEESEEVKRRFQSWTVPIRSYRT